MVLYKSQLRFVEMKKDPAAPVLLLQTACDMPPSGKPEFRSHADQHNGSACSVQPKKCSACTVKSAGLLSRCCAKRECLAADWNKAFSVQAESVAVSDEQLLRQIAEGDHRAFMEFFDRCAPRVNGLVVTLLRNTSDVDDVVQEVFCQVWTSAGNYNEARGTPLAWVVMIARSRALDLLRKRKRRGDAAELCDAEAMAEQNSGPAVAAERAEIGQRVQHVLSSLPAEQQQLIALSFLAGLNHEEIATKLKLPLGTVKTRIRRGIAGMRSVLGKSMSVTHV